MSYDDLMGFIKALEEREDLTRIKTEVDWDREIGAIAEEATVKNSPALLFENIKDYKNGHCKKLFINALATRERTAIGLGLSEDTSYRKLVEYYRDRSKEMIKPILVSRSPVKEVIHRDDDVNLLEFPVPKLHVRDGGRYIATWAIVITKDPDSGWVNWGVYRGMVSDRRSTTNLWIGPRHGLYHARKYYERGEKCPVAIVIGVEPVLLLAAISDVPMGVNECDLAGGLKGEPVKLIKCETIDLEVPANSEIVLEGYLDLNPDTFKPEGPFGEYPGYYSELGSVLRPVFTVNCITHRNDPIFLASPVGVASHFGVGDPESAIAVTLSAQIWDRIEKVGVQGITGVWTPPEAIFHNVYISINKLFYGHAQWVASALWGAIPFAGKLVVVVDSDIDVYDMRNINSALAYRFQSYRGLMVFKGHMSSLDPSVDPDQRKKAGDIGRWDKMLLDATWPSDWEPRKEWGGLKHPPSCLADKEDIERVRNRWSEYGFK